MEGIAEEWAIQVTQGGKRTWGQKWVFVQAGYLGGKIVYMMYRVIHQSCKLFLEGFTYWRAVVHLGRNTSLGRVLGKGQCTSESHWSHVLARKAHSLMQFPSTWMNSTFAELPVQLSSDLNTHRGFIKTLDSAWFCAKQISQAFTPKLTKSEWFCPIGSFCRGDVFLTLVGITRWGGGSSPADQNHHTWLWGSEKLCTANRYLKKAADLQALTFCWLCDGM